MALATRLLETFARVTERFEEGSMSKKQIILLAIIALADLCLLGVGAVVVLTAPKTTAAAITPVVIVSSTPLPSSTPTATPKTPTATATHWATWTPFPSPTPFPSITPSPTATPSVTPTSTRGPTSTPRSASSGGPGTPGGSKPSGSGPVPGRITCGTPNGEPTGGKLSATWSVIAWQVAPDDPNRVIGTMRVLASGGDDCYKFSLLGKSYDYQPIDFQVNMCSSTPTDLIVTSRDGQTWKQTFILDAKQPGWNCK
jgi:hypothetical protein